MDRVLEEISKLRLDHLSDEWVDTVFLFEFTGFENIPENYERILDAIDIQSIFESLLESLEDVEVEENTWAYLSQEVMLRNLLAVIGHYIKLGIDQVADAEYRDSSLLAARVYFRLLMIPGARAYDVYHSQLFAHTISCLSFPKMMCDKSDHLRNNRHLSEEVNRVLRSLSNYVIDLRDIILQLKLRPDDINFEDILGNLVDVTGGAITQTLNNVDRILLSNVSGMIYQVITCMLCDYGDQPNAKAIELLFKCMVPKLIAVSGDTRAPTGFVRASYVTYAGVILTSYGKKSIKSYTIMLEHLCYNTESLERAEARSARADLVVGLMSLLPDRRHRKFLQWLLLLSTTAKIVHRHIALEILSRLLNNEPEINEQRESIWKEIEKQQAIAVSLRNVASDHPYGRAPPADDAAHPAQRSDDNEGSESDGSVAGILRQQPHLVPLGGILAAVFGCAQDVSSAVRTRALAVLAESAASDQGHMTQALEELRGSGSVSRLTALAAGAACDERAVVRRAGVALLLRQLARAPNALTADELEILVKLCRDAAITVRSAAIAAIADLLMQRPSEVLMDAFLSGPMHQLSDPENKVQDQVKSLLDQLIIKRLSKYVPGGCAEDPLPWMLLQGIIDKNMKRNLETACTLLAKTDKCLSVRLVDVLSSHLGAEGERRDLQTLLLLNCAAPHVDYADLGFVLEYYYRRTEDQPPDAARSEQHTPLLSLTVELLSTWSAFLRPPDRAELRDRLVTRLATAHDDGCRVPSAVLAKALDPSNLMWANELMQLSEQRAYAGGCMREALRAADLALVAPAEPAPRLLRLFLAAIDRPPPDWSSAQAGATVAGAGRLCLRSREAAARAAPALARLLHAELPLSARLNALLALADISQRHSNVVDPLMGSVCGCLRAGRPPRLRRAAARAVTELLLSEYLKMNRALFFNYCALLADTDHAVREPAEYYVTSCMRVDTIMQFFVDTVLHYNKDQIEVPLEWDARQLVYDVLLQRMSLVQRLGTQVRLARDVLGRAAARADAGEALPPALGGAVLDAIKVLTGPRMRLPRKPQQTADMADIDDLQERVTNNIVSHKMKRTVAEVLVPAVMRLYARLAAGGGQLAAYLVLLAQELEHDYKQEIEELIENDEELVTRIAFFRENFSVDSSAGNSRNLVTSSGPPEPETPRPQRRRATKRDPLKKRSLKI